MPASHGAARMAAGWTRKLATVSRSRHGDPIELGRSTVCAPDRAQDQSSEGALRPPRVDGARCGRGGLLLLLEGC